MLREQRYDAINRYDALIDCPSVQSMHLAELYSYMGRL